MTYPYKFFSYKFIEQHEPNLKVPMKFIGTNFIILTDHILIRSLYICLWICMKINQD